MRTVAIVSSQVCVCCLQALGQRGKVVRVFDSGDLRIAMREGSTWTFNPDCCTLLSEELSTAAAAAAAANADDADDSSSDDEDEDSIQITCMSSRDTV